jgi:hypothetical protein
MPSYEPNPIPLDEIPIDLITLPKNIEVYKAPSL